MLKDWRVPAVIQLQTIGRDTLIEQGKVVYKLFSPLLGTFPSNLVELQAARAGKRAGRGAQACLRFQPRSVPMRQAARSQEAAAIAHKQ